jgi:uncharacterized protein (DUF433 family)
MSSVVKIDPEIMSGAPCFAGTRVPIQNLIDCLEGGDSIEDFLEGFPSVSREQVIAFLEEAKECMRGCGEVKIETRSFPNSLVATLAILPSMSLIPAAPFSSTNASIADSDATSSGTKSTLFRNVAGAGSRTASC